MRVALVTGLAWPELSASDRLYAEALTGLGVTAVGAPWNGPPEPFVGAYSHAALKRPAAGEFRVNSDYRGTIEAFNPDESLVQQAGAALGVLDESPLYARVDAIVRDGTLVVTELELNEPSLSLVLAPGSAERFAEATVRRLRPSPAGSSADRR